MIFVIEYNRKAGRIKGLHRFSAQRHDEAIAKRLELELADPTNLDLEVVVLEAEGEEELKKTHRRYFASAEELLQSAADQAHSR